jgi:hypothetical protein
VCQRAFARSLIVLLAMLCVPTASADGKLEEARKQVTSKENDSADRSSTNSSNSDSGGQSSIGNVFGLILTAPIWIIPYISWHTDVGYFEFPYENNQPGYFASRFSKSPLFETNKEQKGSDDQAKEDFTNDQEKLPEKSWASQAQFSFGKEDADLNWIIAQLSAESRYHIGLWVRHLSFKEKTTSGDDHLTLQDLGLLFDYLKTEKFSIGIGFGTFRIIGTDTKDSLATKVRVDIFPVKPLHYAFDYSHALVNYNGVVVRTALHTFGVNWNRVQPFLSYQRTDIGSTIIKGNGFGIRLWF